MLWMVHGMRGAATSSWVGLLSVDGATRCGVTEGGEPLTTGEETPRSGELVAASSKGNAPGGEPNWHDQSTNRGVQIITVVPLPNGAARPESQAQETV